jgi:SsuE family FMN reductase
MATIVTISSSPSSTSRTDAILSHVTRRLAVRGHEATQIILRDLPAEPLLRGDARDPQIAAAVQLLESAAAVVVTTPVYKAAYSGLLKVFLDLLPQHALRGKQVLPLATGGTLAHVLAVDYALRPVLTSLGATHVAQGWFVLASHVRLFEGGGVLLDPAASGPLHDVTDEFLRTLEGRAPAAARSVAQTVDPRAVKAVVVSPDHPVAAPLLTDLLVEYGTRYAGLSANVSLTEVPSSDFEKHNGGALVLLTTEGETVAGGAIRRLDSETAEIKRVWTSNRHRRRGLGRRVLVELERIAADRGYRRLSLTTGPRQPEAAGLYLSAGYTPHFDLEADPETIGRLPFTKDLVAVPSNGPESGSGPNAEASRSRLSTIQVGADALRELHSLAGGTRSELAS